MKPSQPYYRSVEAEQPQRRGKGFHPGLGSTVERRPFSEELDNVFAADFGLIDVIWSIVLFFLFLMWLWLVVSIFADLILNKDLSGAAKALWAIALVVFPYVGVFAYLFLHGGRMGERAEAKVNQASSPMRLTSGAEELEKLAGLRQGGMIDEADYQKLKADIVNR